MLKEQRNKRLTLNYINVQISNTHMLKQAKQLKIKFIEIKFTTCVCSSFKIDASVFVLSKPQEAFQHVFIFEVQLRKS